MLISVLFCLRTGLVERPAKGRSPVLGANTEWVLPLLFGFEQRLKEVLGTAHVIDGERFERPHDLPFRLRAHSPSALPPCLPRRLFRLRNVATANVVGVLWAAAMFA